VAPEAAIRPDVPLAPFSTLGVGGAARAFLRAESEADVVRAQEWCDRRNVPLFVLGGGSNIVIADQGFDGLVLQVALRGVTFAHDGDDTLIHAAAGEPWDAIVAAAVARELAGIECLSGIPGCVGGTPIQNVGAYGQEVAETIASVTVFDRRDRRMAALTAAECEFAYRLSRFKTRDVDRFVVCGVTFRLRRGHITVKYPDVQRYLEHAAITSPTLADVRAAVLAIRRGKGMVVDPSDPDSRSVGSFFMNPIVSIAARERVASIAGETPPAYTVDDAHVKVPAAWLIERAGFYKGFVDGAAGISSKHPLALINRGGATASDVLRLAARIKRQVADRFGVWLRPEPIFVGFAADPDVEYLLGHF
jgi:UDP-N-acetylmuramate dehydrogenase